MDRPDGTAMTRGRLIAIDGVDGGALRAVARAVVAGEKAGARAGISDWDASGVFEELAIADRGALSPRALLVLYAADLAFRLRWEIAPALQEGRTVIAAPYVQTAVAFGRAVGLPSSWLSNLFAFAPRPSDRRVVDATSGQRGRREGFVDVAIARWGKEAGVSRGRISRAMAAHLHRRRAPR